MKKAHNFKPRKSEQTSASIREAKKHGMIDSFETVRERGFGVCRDLGGRNPVTVDWRVQWFNEQARSGQIFELRIGKEKAQVSYNELYNLLRHT